MRRLPCRSSPSSSILATGSPTRRRETSLTSGKSSRGRSRSRKVTRSAHVSNGQATPGTAGEKYWAAHQKITVRRNVVSRPTPDLDDRPQDRGAAGRAPPAARRGPSPRGGQGRAREAHRVPAPQQAGDHAGETKRRLVSRRRASTQWATSRPDNVALRESEKSTISSSDDARQSRSAVDTDTFRGGMVLA